MNYTQPYMMNGVNPYQQYQPSYQQNMYQQPMYQPIQRQPDFNKFGLNGKPVDSIETAKAMDIPFDSISYFPLTDNSAIITKQIQIDGTAKMVVYKPIIENESQVPTPNYMTIEDFKTEMRRFDNLDNKELVEEFKALKKEIEALKDSLKTKSK